MTEYAPPWELISRATLEELERSVVPVSADTLDRFAARDAGPLFLLTDPATVAAVEWLEGLGDLDDDELAGISRSIAMEVALRAAPAAGYLAARLVLGTLDQEVAWSTNEDDADVLDEVANAIDVTALRLPPAWGTAAAALHVRLAVEGGDRPDVGPLRSVTATAWASAATIALLEHDCWTGRSVSGSSNSSP